MPVPAPSSFGIPGAAKPENLLHPGYLPARTYLLYEGTTSATIAVAAIDISYLFPFRIFDRVRFTAIAVRVATLGSGSAVKAGIYRNSRKSSRPFGAPLFADNTGVSTATTGNKNLAMAGYLEPGFYWFGSKYSATLPIMYSSGGAGPVIGSVWMGGAVTTGIASPMGFSIADAFSGDMSSIAEGAAFTEILSGVPVAAMVT